MPFVKKVWDETTPINPTSLNRMEQGIKYVHDNLNSEFINTIAYQPASEYLINYQLDKDGYYLFYGQASDNTDSYLTSIGITLDDIYEDGRSVHYAVENVVTNSYCIQTISFYHPSLKLQRRFKRTGELFEWSDWTEEVFVVEKGSDYVRYSNGKQECWMTAAAIAPTNLEDGVYSGGTMVNFPVNFYQGSHINVSLSTNASGSNYWTTVGVYFNDSVYVKVFANVSISTSISPSVYAIGWWRNPL